MPTLKQRIDAFLKPESQRTDSFGLRSPFSQLIGQAESGVIVNHNTALTFSAVYQAIGLWGELPASLPIDFYEEKGANRHSIEHPMKDLLMEPNGLMNRFTFIEYLCSSLASMGNGVALLDMSRNGSPQQIIPVNPECVEPRMRDGQLYYKIDDPDVGIKDTFFAEEIIHFRGRTKNRFWGMSPIDIARDNIGLALASEKFGSRFFKKGGNIKAVLETPNQLDDASFSQFKKRWDSFYSGEAGDHAVPILEYGITYKPLGITPENAQFLQTRQFSIQDVARWFNLPPHMLGDLSRSTFSNIEHQDLQFVKYSFRPVIRRIEIELEHKLLRPEEKGKIRIRFNLDGLLRGDLASVTSHIREMVVSGVMSPDEGRGLLNRNERADGRGGQYYDPANITGKKENRIN